jgi:hypothetical protein
VKSFRSGARFVAPFDMPAIDDLNNAHHHLGKTIEHLDSAASDWESVNFDEMRAVNQLLSEARARLIKIRRKTEAPKPEPLECL